MWSKDYNHTPLPERRVPRATQLNTATGLVLIGSRLQIVRIPVRQTILLTISGEVADRVPA